MATLKSNALRTPWGTNWKSVQKFA